ncbi:MAG: hypothetical protein AABY00_03610 [Nanoarchaeota archaeon]
MDNFLVRSSKAQLKIQEMAFVLVACMIFLALAAVFYLSLKGAGGKETILDQREQEVIESLRKLADSSELEWSDAHEQCKGCIDLDKAILLKETSRNKQTQVLWNMNALSLEVMTPQKEGECTLGNYPECKTLTLINATSSARIERKSAFVALCHREQKQRICRLGKIIGSPKEVSR